MLRAGTVHPGSRDAMRILGVCGSLQAVSSNRALPALDAAGAPPSVVAWRDALAGCDAELIASREYGGSLPGALKNAIDQVIGSGELHLKPVAQGDGTDLALAGLVQALVAEAGARPPLDPSRQPPTQPPARR